MIYPVVWHSGIVYIDNETRGDFPTVFVCAHG